MPWLQKAKIRVLFTGVIIYTCLKKTLLCIFNSLHESFCPSSITICKIPVQCVRHRSYNFVCNVYGYGHFAVLKCDRHSNYKTLHVSGTKLRDFFLSFLRFCKVVCVQQKKLPQIYHARHTRNLLRHYNVNNVVKTKSSIK